jgi:hypothetical protein
MNRAPQHGLAREAWLRAGVDRALSIALPQPTSGPTNKGYWMRKARRGWTMLEEDARTMLRLIEKRIRASDIQVEHRHVLIRLRDMIEGDLAAFEQDRASEPGSVETDIVRPTG